MTNPAHHLLDYVDEHKTEMKDDTYIGIVDRLKPINDKLETDNTRTLYKVFFLVSGFRKDEHDASVCEIYTHSKEVEIFLSQQEVDIINNQLNNYGCIHQFHIGTDELRLKQGLHSIVTFKQVFTKHWELCEVEVDVNHNTNNESEYRNGALLYNSNVVITRIKNA